MRSIGEIIKTVAQYLNEHHIPYVVVGGFAVMLYGRPRATADIDIIISIYPEDIHLFVEFLKENGFFADENDMIMAFRERGHCTVEDKDTLFRLDIKGVYDEMDRASMERRAKTEFEGVDLYVCSPEDLILSKLRWGREEDIYDALSVYVRNIDSLDMEYLRKKSEEMGMEDRLEDLIEMAKEGGEYGA